MCRPILGNMANPVLLRTGMVTLLLVVVSRKTTRYCWSTPCKVLEVLFLGEVSSTFLPSKKAGWTHKFRHVGVDQQYPTLSCDVLTHQLLADSSDTQFERVNIRISNQYSMKAFQTQEVMDILIQYWRGGRTCLPASRYVNAVSNTLASFKSVVSNPSVNQWYTGARRSWASACLPCCCQRRLRLMAARSSSDFAS